MKKTEETTTNKQKVLVADDDEATRILLRIALEQWGYIVVEAEDGEEAWRILQQPDPPQILTLDWLMPKMDGISLCKKINRELSFRPYTIFLTRMSATQNMLEGLEAGADEFIIKPFDLAELRIRIFAGERILKYRNQFFSLLNELFNILKIIKATGEMSDNQKTQQLENISIIQDKIQEMITQIQSSLPAKSAVPAENISTTEVIINMQRMQTFFGNNIEAIQDFIKTFITLADDQITEIENAIQNRDIKSAKYYFHLLGSASGNSGMMKIYDICGKGEEKVVEENWDEINHCHQQLKKAMTQLRQESTNLPSLK